MDEEEFERKFGEALDSGVTIIIGGTTVMVFPDAYGIDPQQVIHLYVKHHEIASCKINDIGVVH